MAIILTEKGERGTRFFFLKFPSEEVADYWVNGDNPTGKRCVAVYFGSKNAEERRSEWKSNRLGGSERQGGLDDFFSACETSHEDTVFVVFLHDDVAFLRPTSKIQDLSEDWRRSYNATWGRTVHDGKEEFPKICETEEVKRTPRWKLPYVLATSNADQGLNRRTCTRYSKTFHLNALRRVFNQQIERPTDARILLENLGPIELETLVFLNLHHRGIFSPANRGSTIKGVDILAYTENRDHVGIPELSPVTFKKSPTRFQIKHTVATIPANDDDYDYLVALEAPSSPKLLDGGWVMRATSTQDDCYQWLKNTLSWTGWSSEEWDEIRKKYR